MYVEDIDDLDELHDLLREAGKAHDLPRGPFDREQALWDYRDIQARIDEIEQERQL